LATAPGGIEAATQGRKGYLAVVRAGLKRIECIWKQ
jgi:hypothetical protein